jgi:uncharacterized protein with FMN-binding domain
MRRVILAAVNTIVGLILLLSFKAHALPATLPTPPAGISQTTTSTTTGSSSPSTSTANSTANSTGTTASGATVTVTGSAAQTKYGPVQVQLTVTNGQITAVDAVVYPTSSSRDRQINARAIPQLDQEALTAQSAKIDTVSGATYTTTGYRTSLQSALDQAAAA